MSAYHLFYPNISKQTLNWLLISILFWGTSHLSAQVTIDHLAGGAFCHIASVIPQSGTLNGRPFFEETVGTSHEFVRWTGARWETGRTIESGTGAVQISHINTADTALPPCSANFPWSAGPNLNECGATSATLILTGPDCSTILPVELVSFTAFQQEEDNKLVWITASEINNEKFIVEHSVDGISYFAIGEVEGNGTTAQGQNYAFSHTKPTVGTNYYRLQQVDYDGTFAYSPIILVEYNANSNIVSEIYPNPSRSGLINVNYVASKNHEVTLSIYDQAGRLLLINSNQLMVRGLNTLELDVREIGKGLFLLTIAVEDRMFRRKLLIQ